MSKARVIRAAALCLWAGAAGAQDVTQIPYDELEARVAGLFDFEGVATLPEPGQVVDGTFGNARVQIGERFDGMALEVHDDGRSRFDKVTVSPPALPLRLVPGTPGHNHSIAYHAGFGSNALFPLGPERFPAASARGEGALALRFDPPVDAFGFRVHADYVDPLGSRPPPGRLTLVLHDADGRMIAMRLLKLQHGRMGFAFEARGIASVTLTNTDPGGVAFDDILYPILDLGS